MLPRQTATFSMTFFLWGPVRSKVLKVKTKKQYTFYNDYLVHMRHECFQVLSTTTLTKFLVKNNDQLWLNTTFSDHNLGYIEGQS